MSLLLPPAPGTTTGEANFSWIEPDAERELFDARVRAIMGISGRAFLRNLDSGEYDEELEEESNLDLSYLATLSAIGR